MRKIWLTLHVSLALRSRRGELKPWSEIFDFVVGLNLCPVGIQ